MVDASRSRWWLYTRWKKKVNHLHQLATRWRCRKAQEEHIIYILTIYERYQSCNDLPFDPSTQQQTASFASHLRYTLWLLLGYKSAHTHTQIYVYVYALVMNLYAHETEWWWLSWSPRQCAIYYITHGFIDLYFFYFSTYRTYRDFLIVNKRKMKGICMNDKKKTIIITHKTFF